MTTQATMFQEVEQRDREFEAAFNGGDIPGLAALYTEDATLMPPDSAIITGREAIQQFWQAVRDSGVSAVALRPQKVEGSGEMVVEIATAELTADSGNGQSSTIPVKYVVVWKRGSDGQLQLAVDIWNSSPSG